MSTRQAGRRIAGQVIKYQAARLFIQSGAKRIEQSIGKLNLKS